VTRRIRLDARPEPAEKDLAGLVLTIVDLLRQLMERQALRRVDGGSLTEEQIESAGVHRCPWRLSRWPNCGSIPASGPKTRTLDLGPLGQLLPRE